MRKILRDAYKHLKGLGNINRVPLNSPEEHVTVVSQSWELAHRVPTKIRSKKATHASSGRAIRPLEADGAGVGINRPPAGDRILRSKPF